MIVALSRFGTFSNLQATTSARDDIYPSTATFSFHGASYTSDYVDFSSVELQSNVRSGRSYATLQTPAQNQLVSTYNAPPYVPASSAGSIPFIDFGNQYIISDASFDVGVLQGLTQDAVAASLANPASAQAKAILGTANVLTATVCILTGDQPTSVCGDPAIQALKSTLPSRQP